MFSFLGFNLNAQQVIFSSSDSLRFSSWTFFLKMVTHTVDIAHLCGKNNVFILFRHYDCFKQYFLVIDDVLVTIDSTASNSKLNPVKLSIYPIPTGNSLTIVWPLNVMKQLKKTIDFLIMNIFIKIGFQILYSCRLTHRLA